jgi:peptidoglycan/LPS O-acetylase OafA/YrhL
LLAASCALLILVVSMEGARAKRVLTSLLSRPLLRLFGKHSYAIYLLHLPLHLFAARHLLPHLPRLVGRGLFLSVQGAYMALVSFVLLGLAVVFYHVVERPLLGLKRYFVARRPALGAPGTVLGRG